MSNKIEYIEQYKHFSLTHKGVRVDVVVDIKEQTVSITDEYRGRKDFLFQKRGLEYQKWWYDILEAIKLWMDEWFRILKEHRDNITEKVVKLYAESEGK